MERLCHDTMPESRHIGELVRIAPCPIRDWRSFSKRTVAGVLKQDARLINLHATSLPVVIAGADHTNTGEIQDTID